MGVDLATLDRSWRWFTTRVMGLLSRAPVYRGKGEQPLHASRLGRALYPPE